jgi:outer membrane autotransporter protein
MNSGGGATGIDLRLDKDTLLGVTMGTASAAYDLSDLMSFGTARSLIFGIYGGHSRGPAYIDGALAYGYSTFTTNRTIGTGTLGEVANASFDGYQYGGRVEGGWRFGIDRHWLTPFAGLTAQAFQQSGYTETSRNVTTGAPGMLAVSVQGQTTTSGRAALGAQFETAILAYEGNAFRPRLRLGWGHEYNVNRSATVSLSSLLPGAPFQVTGAQAAADSLVVGAGFDLELGGMVRLYGQFDGNFASNASAFAGTGGVRLLW